MSNEAVVFGVSLQDNTRIERIRKLTNGVLEIIISILRKEYQVTI
ncbi:hypothetical protein GCM10011412_25620 [Maribacter cobaltidurans]|nr:hypothetical protein GCM10011412_25620 [Maribacter cobaltidurans]